MAKKVETWIVILVVALILIGGGYFLSIGGSLPNFTQTVPTNAVAGSPATVTESIGPLSLGGLNGNGGETDAFYNIISVKLDGQTILAYTSCGSNCWQYTVTPVNINGSYVSATLTTLTNMSGYYHASGYNMCDAVHQNIAGQRFNVPFEPVYAITFTGLPAGSHTMTTNIIGGSGIIYDPTGYHICAGATGGITLSDTFVVSTAPAPQPPNPVTDFWNSLQSFIQGIINWLRSLGLPLTIASASTPVNVPYSTTVTLTGVPVSNLNYASGFESIVSCAPFVVDSNGNYLFKGTVTTNISSSTYNGAISFTPTTAGTFAQGAACTQQNTTYNYTSQTWSPWTSPAVVASDKGTLAVSGPNQPPVSTGDFWAGITTWFNGLVCWLKQFLGGTC